MGHERETLEAVIAARGAAQAGLAAAKANPGDGESMAQLAAAQGQLNAGLGRLLAVAEAYPDLKANQNMMQLTEELTSAENKVAFARRIQRFGDGLQQPTRSVSVQRGRRHVQFRAGGFARHPSRQAGRSPRRAQSAVLTPVAAMNFFERQAAARRASSWLTVLFVLAIVAIVKPRSMWSRGA